MNQIRFLALFLFCGPTPALPAQAASGLSVQVAPGLQYDLLSRYTASLWILAPTSVQHYAEATLSRGPSVMLDAGTGGGKLLLGWTNAGGFGGGGLLLGVLRTWNKPDRLQPRQTFCGAEIRGYLSGLAYGGGFYQRISGSAPGGSNSVDISLGVWFRL